MDLRVLMLKIPSDYKSRGAVYYDDKYLLAVDANPAAWLITCCELASVVNERKASRENLLRWWFSFI